MFSSTLTALAVAGLLASNAAVGQPAWQTDYSKALQASSELHKPIAVFITSGDQSKLVDGGDMGSEVARMLREKFVPLHVDTTTKAGQTLASSFELKVGLVISDSTGGVQALRHDGTLSGEALKTHLERFAATSPVTTTMVTSSAAPSAVPNVAGLQYQYAPARCVGGNCGQAQYLQPQYAQPGLIQAAPGMMYSLVVSGTCRNGNCGQR